MPDGVALREVMGRLTPLRRSICRLLAAGYTQREVAEWFAVTPQTVCDHVRRVREVLLAAGFEGADVRQTRCLRWSGLRKEARDRVGS